MGKCKKLIKETRDPASIREEFAYFPKKPIFAVIMTLTFTLNIGNDTHGTDE